MKSPLIAIIVALGAAFSTYADVLKIKKDAPKQYVVKKAIHFGIFLGFI